MKRLISITLCLILFIGIFSICTVSAKETTSYGDMDGNFEVTAADALVVLQGSVNKIKLSDEQSYYADVDLDEKLSASDALTILQYSVNKICVIPLGDYIQYNQELLVDTDGMLIDNGAYAKDATADCSFQITTEGLQEKTIYLLTSGLKASYIPGFSLDTLRFVCCLQGLINRDYGITHTSMLYMINSSVGADNFWYRYMIDEGNLLYGYTIKRIDNIDTFVTTFANQISQCGITLWDQNVPSTSNVANTICGIDGNLPVRYDTSTNCFYSYLKNKMAELNMPLEEESLVGKFTGTGIIPDTNYKSTNSTKCDAYIWAIDKYIDKVSMKFVAYTLDAATTIDGHPLSTEQDAKEPSILGIYNYDYFIARRCFFIDLTVNPCDSACDDPTQPVGTDAQTMYRFLLARYNRANGNFGVMIGFSPFLLKYTTVNNNTSIPSYDAVASEFLSTETFTIYNMSTEADAPSPVSAPNCSAYYKYIVKDVEFQTGTPDTSIKYDKDTYYYFIDAGDYDSSIWQLSFIPKYWTDSAKQFPLFWNINPNNTDRIPVVFEYMYKNWSEYDFMGAGDSGAGYIWPVALTEGHVLHTYGADYDLRRTLPTATDKYYAYASKYYKLLNYDITGFLLDVFYTIEDSRILDMYNALSPVGGFYQGSDPQSMYIYNGVPYLRKISYGVGNTAEEGYNTIIASHSNGTQNFTCLHTAAWSPTTFKTYKDGIESIAENNGKKFQWVDVYTFFRLLKESGKLKNWAYAK